MLKLYRPIAVGVVSVAMTSLFTPSAGALGKDDPLYVDDIGTRTVKCQVHENAPGNPVAGFVFGNHKKDPLKAEKDADLFVGKFGNDHTKRHCKTQKKYVPHGAYDSNMNPM